MLGLPKLYLANKEAVLREFDNKLTKNPDFLNKDDRRTILAKYSAFDIKIRNSFGYGSALGLFALWNMRGLENLSLPFKIFATVSPVVLFPAYYYLTEHPRIEALKILLYLKNHNYQLPTTNSHTLEIKESAQNHQQQDQKQEKSA